MKNRFLPSFKQFTSEKSVDPKNSIIDALAAIKRFSSQYDDSKDPSVNPIKILGRI